MGELFWNATRSVMFHVSLVVTTISGVFMLWPRTSSGLIICGDWRMDVRPVAMEDSIGGDII